MGKRERERGTLHESGVCVPRRLVAGYGISAAVTAALTQTPCSVQGREPEGAVVTGRKGDGDGYGVTRTKKNNEVGKRGGTGEG